MGQVKRVVFNVYVALNMLLCSVAFFWCALPRETISGLVGRKVRHYVLERPWQSRAWRGAQAVVNTIYWWEADHCNLVALQERDARAALYP